MPNDIMTGTVTNNNIAINITVEFAVTSLQNIITRVTMFKFCTGCKSSQEDLEPKTGKVKTEVAPVYLSYLG